MKAAPARSLPYLGMSYLYERSNRLWHVLIGNRLVARTWRPLVEMTRRRHIDFRARLAARETPELNPIGIPASLVSAGV